MLPDDSCATHLYDFYDDVFRRNLLIDLRFDAKWNANPHDEQEPWEYQVSEMKSIPNRMIDPPVMTAAWVHEDHQNDGDACIMRLNILFNK